MGGSDVGHGPPIPRSLGEKEAARWGSDTRHRLLGLILRGISASTCMVSTTQARLLQARTIAWSSKSLCVPKATHCRTNQECDEEETKKPGMSRVVSGPRSELRRQESNLRPPGYEPGELTAAPRRTLIIAGSRVREKFSQMVFVFVSNWPRRLFG